MKKKRLFGILLSLALMLTMMPVLGLSQPAYAGSAIYNPASTYTGFNNLITNDTEVTIREVSDKTWYVIGYDSSAKTVTLLSKQTFGNHAFNSDDSKGNDYATSDIKTYVGGLTGTGQPLAGISNVLSSDGQPTLIDITTAQGLSETKRKLEGANWWLCSQGYLEFLAAGVYGGTGDVNYDGFLVADELGVRPALKLDLSKVMFNSSTNTFSIIEYPLWVGGTQVTGENATDTTAHPTWSYDAESKTLTLNNYNNDGAGYSWEESSRTRTASIYAEQNLTIELKGESTVSSNDYGVCVADGGDNKYNLTICGSGKLIASSDNESAICSRRGDITIDGSKIEASSSNSMALYTFKGNISINDSEVEANCNDEAIITCDGNVSISNSEIETTTDSDYGINGNDVTLNNSVVSADGSYVIYATGNIEINNSKIEESRGSIYSYEIVTIRDSQVKTEAGTNVLQGSEGVNIEYTGGGKYSTRVEAIATGDPGPQGLSANRIDSDKIAVWAKKNGLNIGDKLAITKPEGGRVGDAEGSIDDHKYSFSTIVDGKGNPADHVIIEVAKPAPAPTPSPVANPLTVNTTAKTTTRATTIKWTWNAVDGASKYKVAYHKVGSKKWKVKTTKKTKYVLKGQKIKGLYEYKVAAVTASGDVWSDTSCRYFKTVKARAKFSKGALKVSWKKDKGAAGYEVFIARNKKMDGAQVIQVAADSKSYSVSGLENGRYYVKVRPMKNYNGVTYTGILCKARKVKVK